MASPLTAMLSTSKTKIPLLCNALWKCHISEVNRFLSVTVAQYQRRKNSTDVCQSPDKTMIMCWHPEPDFPYEHTQPLVRDKTELTEGESVLKVQHLLDDKLKNIPEGPTDEELSRIFFTSKRVWRMRPRHEKRVKMRSYTPIDRKGL